jgi:hypothetical protein
MNVEALFPPHTIIWLPAQTAVCSARAAAAFTGAVGVHALPTGSNRAPSARNVDDVAPPHTIIS